MSRFADIVLPLAQPAYTFAVGEGMEVRVGDAVAVQFGKNAVYTGIVWRLHDTPPKSVKAKPILKVLYDKPLLSELQMRFWEWVADYYICSVGEVMRVALQTVHIPVDKVAASLSTEKIAASLVALRHTLKQDFGVVEPRIAVLSLNPHAGDGGLLGSEEEQIIRPAIIEAVDNGVLAFGPLAADGLFAGGGYKKYDAILAMYHDQGLTPFKALSPEGVNFTAGLNIVRTSPDHGTAFDIAGKDLADAQSMRNAIYEAIDICSRRNDYKYWSRNPLEHFEREKGRDVSMKDLQEAEERKAQKE